MSFVALALALAQPAALAEQAVDLTGVYIFEGSCPSLEPDYRGRLTIARFGELYSLVWSIDGSTLVGTGLLDRDRMSVEFREAGGAGGLMQMRREGRRWRGTWARYSAQQICTETWRPA